MHVPPPLLQHGTKKHTLCLWRSAWVRNWRRRPGGTSAGDGDGRGGSGGRGGAGGKGERRKIAVAVEAVVRVTVPMCTVAAMAAVKAAATTTVACPRRLRRRRRLRRWRLRRRARRRWRWSRGGGGAIGGGVDGVGCAADCRTSPVGTYCFVGSAAATLQRRHVQRYSRLRLGHMLYSMSWSLNVL